MSHQIIDAIDKSSKIIFYPSSCGYSDEFQNVPYELVILNSHEIKQKEKKGNVYCLNYDNNELLGLLFARGISISAVVIIRDGCIEGGNYECVLEDGFFGRLMPVASKSFKYFCDHEPATVDAPAQSDKIDTPDYLIPFISNSDPINKIKSFHVKLKPKIEKVFKHGNILVRIIWDSIWCEYNRSELVVIKKIGSSKKAVENYLKGLLSNDNLYEKFEYVTQSRMGSIDRLLHKAEKKHLSRISLIPIAGGRYKKIAREIQLWSNDYPKEIDFFHLNKDDYKDLKSL